MINGPSTSHQDIESTTFRNHERSVEQVVAMEPQTIQHAQADREPERAPYVEPSHLPMRCEQEDS